MAIDCNTRIITFSMFIRRVPVPLSPRRSFLKDSAASGLILGLSASSYRALTASDAPSERIRVGMIGVGNQGGPKNNMKYFLKNIVAMCDLDKNHLAEAAAFLNDELEVFGAFRFIAHAPAFESLSHEAHRGDGRAQLVRDARDKVAFEFTQLYDRGSRIDQLA